MKTAPQPQSTSGCFSMDVSSSSSDDEQQNGISVSEDSFCSMSTIRTNIDLGVSDVWTLYTETEAPYKLKSAICRHCKLLIDHHKQSEEARRHLLKCPDFGKFVRGLDDSEVPEWYLRQKTVSSTHKCHNPRQSCATSSQKYRRTSDDEDEKNEGEACVSGAAKCDKKFIAIEDIVCKRCDNFTTSSFKDLEFHASIAHGLKHFCAFCQVILSNQTGLSRHMERIHAHVEDNYFHPIKCCRCEHRFDTVINFCKHLQTAHRFKGEIEKLSFPSLEQFNRWKLGTEQRDNFLFYEKHSYRRGDFKWTTLLCHRSGCFLKKKKGPGVNNSCISIEEKSDFCCSAFAMVKESSNDAEISVEYCLEHYGYCKVLSRKNVLQVTLRNNTRSEESIAERLHESDTVVEEEPMETEKVANFTGETSNLRLGRKRRFLPTWMLAETSESRIRKQAESENVENYSSEQEEEDEHYKTSNNGGPPEPRRQKRAAEIENFSYAENECTTNKNDFFDIGDEEESRNEFSRFNDRRRNYESDGDYENGSLSSGSSNILSSNKRCGNSTSKSKGKSTTTPNRPVSDVWSLYTETKAPHKLKSAICRHCKLLVNHHKQSKEARRHLSKCPDFRKFVRGLDNSEVPEWYLKRKTVSSNRPVSDVWTLYTETEAPQKLKSAICRHCKLLVNHHKQSEEARKHLLKCPDFRKFVRGLDDSEVPQWYLRRKTIPSNRPVSDVWTLYTEMEASYKLKSAICRHCKLLVNHHKQSEGARKHLLKCPDFRKFVRGLDNSEVAEGHARGKTDSTLKCHKPRRSCATSSKKDHRTSDDDENNEVEACVYRAKCDKKFIAMKDIVCKRCENFTTSSFKDLELHASMAHKLKHFCAYCQEKLSKSNRLSKHMEKIHADIKDNYLYPIKCRRCEHRFNTVINFCKHLQSAHRFKGKIEKLSFTSRDQFNIWKLGTEQRENFLFYEKQSYRRSAVKRTTLLCHRSGCFLKKKKIPGVNKYVDDDESDFYCSAFAFVEESSTNDEISVECCLEHYGCCKVLSRKNIDLDQIDLQNATRLEESIAERLHGDPVQSMKMTKKRTSTFAALETVDKSSTNAKKDDDDNILLAITSENISKQLSVFSKLVAQPAICDHLVSKPVIARQVLQNLHDIVKLVGSAQSV